MQRKLILLLILMFFALPHFAQITSTTTTPIKSFNIQKMVIPPYLSVVENSVIFSDIDGNNVINANEKSTISFTIRNEGKGDAYGCVVKIRGEGSVEGLSYADCELPIIKAGNTFRVEIPINASTNTSSGQARFMIQVYEPNGFGIDEPIQLTIDTHKFDAPFVEIVSYKILSAGDSQLRKKKPFKLQVLLQNTDQGVAHNVKCSFSTPENMFLQDGENYMQFSSLQPNEKKLLEYEFQSNNNVKDNVNIDFQLSESFGRYAKNASIPLHFGQAINNGMINIQIAGSKQDRVAISKGSLISDVDENIPQTHIQNKNTFVVIIANETYQQVASVPFALNDGHIFRQYCEQTLGIPAKNIREQTNATGNQIKAQINWLRNVVEVFDNPNVIIYYAGHGIPDETSKTAYLLPVDGIVSDMSTCYKLNDLYATLGDMPAAHISVFMDACFSGSKREQGMLASARGVALKARPGEPKGNMVVFSAAQGDETAYPYKDKQHGMFTYYLLKKLQDTKGDVTLQDLGNYITSEVKKQSILENNKSQTPTVTPASAVADSWQNWKLK